jgi:hypothetical protein
MKRLSIVSISIMVLGLIINPAFSQDIDGDGILDDVDNCPNHPNGSLLGTCTSGAKELIGVETCLSHAECDPNGFCSMAQEDSYPPGGNGIGDACDCESDFTCDGDVDGADVTEFLNHYGRSIFNNPCINGNPCSGDFTCDGDVDVPDTDKFLEDVGRFQLNNPCPACEVDVWCVY